MDTSDSFYVIILITETLTIVKEKKSKRYAKTHSRFFVDKIQKFKYSFNTGRIVKNAFDAPINARNFCFPVVNSEWPKKHHEKKSNARIHFKKHHEEKSNACSFCSLVAIAEIVLRKSELKKTKSSNKF